MVTRLGWAGFFLVLMAGATPGFAQSEGAGEIRTYVLKNGSHLKGTLIEEGSDYYLVETASDVVWVNKADLKRPPISPVRSAPRVAPSRGKAATPRAAPARRKAPAPRVTPVRRKGTAPRKASSPRAPSTSKRPIAVARAEGGKTESYKFTILTAELLALGLMLVSPVLGVATHLFSGSLGHLYHGNKMKALGSFALRAGLPIVGGLGAGLLIDDELGLLVAILGVIGAPIIDAVYLANKPVEPGRHASLSSPASVRVLPSVGLTREGNLTFGLAGAF